MYAFNLRCRLGTEVWTPIRMIMTSGSRQQKGRKIMKKLLSAAFLIVLFALVLCSCGKTISITNIDSNKNTFDFVDSSGRVVLFDKMIINGKEVIDYECSGIGKNGAVVFATEKGQIIREETVSEEDGVETITRRTTFASNVKAYTPAAKFTFEFADGVLTITGEK